MSHPVAEAWEAPDNVVVLGQTQTGKTSTVREAHSTTPRVSIWLNATGDDRVRDVEGEVCRSLDDVKQAFASDTYRIEYVASDRKAAVVELRSWLWDVADRTNRELPVQLVVDEVDDVAPQSGKPHGTIPHRHAVRKLTKEGVKRNIKFVAMTQDPSTYDKVSLRQSRYRLVFPMSPEQRRSVSKYGFDWDRVDESPRYAGVMHDSRHASVLGVCKAQEKYA